MDPDSCCGRLNRIDTYFDTFAYFGALTGRETRASTFRDYVQARLDEIQGNIEGLEKPVVYCSLGHPLIAMFEDKLESRLIETAGGRLANRLLERESTPQHTQ